MSQNPTTFERHKIIMSSGPQVQVHVEHCDIMQVQSGLYHSHKANITGNKSTNVDGIHRGPMDPIDGLRSWNQISEQKE